MTDLCFLIPPVTAQIFISTAELVIPTGIETNEANLEIEMQPVTVEAKISYNLTKFLLQAYIL